MQKTTRGVLTVVIAVIVVAVGYYAISQSMNPDKAKYQVLFSQTSCNSLYGVPWGVTLGNFTQIKPANATLQPFGTSSFIDPAAYGFINSTWIAFTVSDGTYQYLLLPSAEFGNVIGSDGNATIPAVIGYVHVSGANVNVTITPNCKGVP